MAGQLTIDSLKTSSGVLATQNGINGIAKAWVQFVGSNGSINGAFNVSSVTRNSTGDYTLNFTTAMVNTNYAWSVSAYRAPNAGNLASASVAAPTTTTFRFVTYDYTFTNTDMTLTSATIFGT